MRKEGKKLDEETEKVGGLGGDKRNKPPTPGLSTSAAGGTEKGGVVRGRDRRGERGSKVRSVSVLG